MHVLERHVDVVVLELEADGRSQLDLLEPVPVHEVDDLLSDAIVALLGLVLAHHRQVLHDRPTRDGDVLVVGLGLEPFHERRQPRLVVLVGAGLATFEYLNND